MEPVYIIWIAGGIIIGVALLVRLLSRAGSRNPGNGIDTDNQTLPHDHSLLNQHFTSGHLHSQDSVQGSTGSSGSDSYNSEDAEHGGDSGFGESSHADSSSMDDSYSGDSYSSDSSSSDSSSSDSSSSSSE